jgi:glucan biosynthesis protein C
MPSIEGSGPPPSAGERLHALDGLRATAMFLGIVLHGFASFAVGLPIPWIVRDARAGISFDLAMAAIHGFRMPLFFFIAGFFAHLLWRRLGTRGFIAHRARRIALPFLLGMATIIPLSIAIYLWVGTPHPPPAKVSIPTMHLWFLEMLLVLYAIAMLLAWASERVGFGNATARLDRGFDALFRTPAKTVVLAALTMIPLWSGPADGTRGEEHARPQIRFAHPCRPNSRSHPSRSSRGSSATPSRKSRRTWARRG